VPLERKKAMIEAVRNIPGVVEAGTVNRVPFYRGSARRAGFRARDD
jgi:hypothetical protein